MIISPLKSRMQSSRISDSGIIRPCKDKFRILHFQTNLKLTFLLIVRNPEIVTGNPGFPGIPG